MNLIMWNEEKWKFRFFSLWTVQALSLFGSYLVQFALIWWLTAQSGKATVLATAMLVAFLPQVILGPFLGALIDRWSRRWVMIAADTVTAMATIVLVYLFATDQATITWIYVLLFVRSLGGAFHMPSMSAATSLMVPKDQLTRVQGLNQLLQGLLAVFAAPIGAMAVELMTTHAILMIDVVTALIAVLPLLVMVIPEPARKTDGNGNVVKTSYWEDFGAGFKYIKAWPGLMMVILLALVLNLMVTPTSALEPLLITQHFNGGALQLGWFNSAGGVGMLAGGILLSVWGGFKSRIRTSLTGIVALGVFMAAVGAFPSNMYWGAVGAYLLAAMMLPMVNGPIRALMQAAVEPEMQGRVFTLVGSLASGLAPLGLMFAGPIADQVGVRGWYVIAGIVCAVAGLAGFFVKPLMLIEENRKVSKSDEPVITAVMETA